MNVRRTLSLVASAALVSGLGLAAAPTVAAAANPSVVSVNPDACPASATTVRANVGDVLTLHNSSTTANLLYLYDGVFNPNPIAPLGQRGIPVGALGVHTLAAANCGPITVNVVTEPVEGPKRTDHDDIQQVGVPASGNCADVPATVGHYPGAPIGGWSKSWAMWINGGTGGPVCTRELDEFPDGTIVLIG